MNGNYQWMKYSGSGHEQEIGDFRFFYSVQFTLYFYLINLFIFYVWGCKCNLLLLYLSGWVCILFWYRLEVSCSCGKQQMCEGVSVFLCTLCINLCIRMSYFTITLVETSCESNAKCSVFVSRACLRTTCVCVSPHPHNQLNSKDPCRYGKSIASTWRHYQSVNEMRFILLALHIHNQFGCITML